MVATYNHMTLWERYVFFFLFFFRRIKYVNVKVSYVVQCVSFKERVIVISDYLNGINTKPNKFIV